MAKRIFSSGLTVLFVLLTGCQMQRPTRTIVFSRLTGDYWQIWIMAPSGKSTKQITTSLSDKRYPFWAENGAKILFRTNNNRVFSIDLENGQERQILETYGLVGSVVESPGGGMLLFVRFRNDLKDSSDLWISTLEGKGQKILTRDVGLQYDPTWSVDGRKIAYVSGHGFQTHELYIVDSNGRNKRRLTDNKALELLPAFSPDDSTIAYVSDIAGDYEIWLMDVDGGNPRRLTNSDGIDTRPCWSPNGKKIMFVSNRNGNQQIWIMNKDGSDAQQLTTGAPSIDPAWKKESL